MEFIRDARNSRSRVYLWLTIKRPTHSLNELP